MGRIVLTLIATTAIAMLVLFAPDSRGGFGDWNDDDVGVETSHWDWARTAAAASQDGQCTQQFGSGHTCVEWCEVYHGGLFLPTGQFCCTSNGVSCTNPLY